jgi:hypothetical protein
VRLCAYIDFDVGEAPAAAKAFEGRARGGWAGARHVVDMECYFGSTVMVYGSILELGNMKTTCFVHFFLYICMRVFCGVADVVRASEIIRCFVDVLLLCYRYR